jgi:methylenetetrahydrofolate reductase (NADPH)
MKIAEILARKRAPGKTPEPVFSFEFFPPKTPKGEDALYRAIDDLKSLAPDFVSVTYGAGGSTREKTVDWVAHIKADHGVESMAHLTCVGASRAEIASVVEQILGRGVENVLALRGDPPRGDANFVPAPDGYAHASELVAGIRGLHGARLSIGVAGYPEKHPEAPDFESDLGHLQSKVAAGADFVITQLFFDNEAYFRYAGRLAAIGVPIIPGIMPITSREQIDKFILMCGASIPPSLRSSVVGASSDEEVVEIGVEYAIRQCRDLLKRGAPGIHFYTLNKSTATRRILSAIR